MLGVSSTLVATDIFNRPHVVQLHPQVMFALRAITPVTVCNHMQTKFATCILHAIDNFINPYILFYIYTNIDNMFFIYF